ncbi:hypothetical protein ACFVUY_39805 [Kitasatospora sp. NPDC058063]|uniref:hypothetical protein n=1 Tax=unclassified Kitasatospora TaxID=2633591 RepID=UPI0036D9EA63
MTSGPKNGTRSTVGRRGWTTYDETYYKAFTAVEEQVRRDLAAGRRHLAEAEMQQAARARRRRHTAP